MSCVALLLRDLVIEKVQREGLDDNDWSATSSHKVWKATFSWVGWSQTRALYLLLQCTKAAKGNPDTYCKKHRLCAKVHFWAGRMIKGAWKLFCILRPMTSITNSCETQFSKQKGDQSLVQPAVSFNEPPIKAETKSFQYMNQRTLMIFNVTANPNLFTSLCNGRTQKNLETCNKQFCASPWL